MYRKEQISVSINSRQKGKRVELELAKELRAIGLTARRTAQFCGDAGDSDVVVEELPELFIECKGVERLNIWDAMEKAVEQAESKIAAVFHTKNRKPWLVTLRMEDMVAFSLLLARHGAPPSETESKSDGT